MKSFLLFVTVIAMNSTFAQDHYGGVNTSKRVGILNTSLNPAELTNLSNKFEVNINGLSFDFSNDAISIGDVSNGSDLEDLIFDGNSTVNASFSSEFYGPGFAMRWQKWGFGLTTKANIQFDLVDADPNLGESLVNLNNLTNSGVLLVGNDFNQRATGTTWGEIALSAARNVYENEKHRFSAGLSLRLLFPGSYTNIGVDLFRGTITTSIDPNDPNNNTATLTNASASLNFAYSGNLSDSGTEPGNYTSSVFGQLKGMATDIGANYQWKDDQGKYKINAGMAIRNIGTMTFSDSNNASNSYDLLIGPGQSLDLTEFDGTESIKDIEKVLSDKGFLTRAKKSSDFKVKLPTLFSFYADFKLYETLFITTYLQKKLNENNNNAQLATQDRLSIIPRVSLRYFEAFIPISFNEISGTNTGLGFRLGGFFISSGSAISSIINDSQQIDFNMGFRWGFL